MATNPGRIIKEYLIDRQLVDNRDVTSNYFVQLKKDIIKDLSI